MPINQHGEKLEFFEFVASMYNRVRLLESLRLKDSDVFWDYETGMENVLTGIAWYSSHQIEKFLDDLRAFVVSSREKNWEGIEIIPTPFYGDPDDISRIEESLLAEVSYYESLIPAIEEIYERNKRLEDTNKQETAILVADAEELDNQNKIITGFNITINGLTNIELNKRMNTFCDALQKSGYIERKDHKLLRGLFTGEKMNHRVNWIGRVNELGYFISLLEEKEPPILKGKDRTDQWQRAAECLQIKGEDINPTNLRTNKFPKDGQVREKIIAIVELLG